MRAVMDGDRDAWLACFAEDAVVHDPVGGSPFDPEGRGLRGHDALRAFWDAGIAPADVTFTIRETHGTEAEAALVGEAHVRLPGGAEARYDGVFAYAVDDGGRITSLRAYWDVGAVLTAFAATASG